MLFLLACECDPHGSSSTSCSSSGECTCNPGYTGDKCDNSNCTLGYYSSGSQCFGKSFEIQT